MGRNQGRSQLVLTNTLLDEPRYIFTDPWTVAIDLAIGTATLKTTDWQIKDQSTRALDYGNKSLLLIKLFGSLI